VQNFGVGRLKFFQAGYAKQFHGSHNLTAQNIERAIHALSTSSH
jgi:hypothetical protein